MHTAHPGPAKIPPDALAVTARFNRPLSAAREKPGVRASAAPQFAQQGGEIVRDGNLPAGTLGFGRLHNDFCAPGAAVNAADRATHCQNASLEIKVAPLQTAYFPDAQAKLHLQQKAHLARRRSGQNKVTQRHLFLGREGFCLLGFHPGQFDKDLHRPHQVQMGSVFADTPQHGQALPRGGCSQRLMAAICRGDHLQNALFQPLFV